MTAGFCSANLCSGRRLFAIFVLAGRGNGEVSSVSEVSSVRGVQRNGHACAGAGSCKQLHKALCPSSALREGQAGCAEQPPGDSIRSD